MMRGLFIFTLFANAIAQQIALPKPDGPHKVAIRTSELTDVSRSDSRGRGSRRLMLSLYSPSTEPQTSCMSPYMPDKVATAFHELILQAANQSLDFNRFVLPLCSIDVSHGLPNTSRSPAEKQPTKETLPTQSTTFPLVFFSPGLGSSRFVNNLVNSFLASHGFLVVSIDHPYSVVVVQYPDGSTAVMTSSLAPNQTEADAEVAERVADSVFTLDQMTNNSTLANLLFSTEARPQSLEKVGFWGHSLGGATAAQTIRQDLRFAGGIDLDGSLSSLVAHTGMSKPFILWQRGSGHNRTNDPSWSAAWPKLTGFRKNLELLGSTHYSFTDAAQLADSYGLNRTLLGFGTINGSRTTNILAEYARDFFEFVLEGKSPKLVDQPSPSFPEVAFVP